jgi:hypothetical protein
MISSPEAMTLEMEGVVGRVGDADYGDAAGIKDLMHEKLLRLKFC